jgi:WD40 repeat protein
LLAIGSFDGIVWVFDFERQAQLAEIKISSGRVVPHVFLARDNRLVIWDAERSPTVYHEWDLTLGVETATWPGPERFGWFATTADQKYALMLETDGVGEVRDMTTGTRRNIRLPIEAVGGAGFSADGRFLAVASRIGYAKVWQFPQETEVARLSGVLGGIGSIAFHPDAPRMATGCSAPHVLRLWDMESHLAVLSFDGKEGTFNETAFSSDGRTLASMSHEGRLRLWFAPSWAEIAASEPTAPTGRR